MKKTSTKNIPVVWKLSQGKHKEKRKPKMDVDLTPMHIPCISGDISKPQISKNKMKSNDRPCSEMCL